jgi:signal transduction histidine kinase
MQVDGLSAQQSAPSQPLQRMALSVREAISASRRILNDLRPRILEDLGLAAALQAQARQAEELGGFACEAVIGAGLDEADLPTDQALTLFRVTQEALNNVRKHAEADSATVALARGADGGWRLVIEDDGRGFEPLAGAEPLSYGLIGMRERLEAHGGSLQVQSTPGRGTVVTATLPGPAAPGSAGGARPDNQRRLGA